VITSRDERKLQKVQDEINQIGNGRVAYHRADITNIEDIQALVQFSRETFGRIDIMINNAEGPPGGKFEQFLIKIGRIHSN